MKPYRAAVIGCGPMGVGTSNVFPFTYNFAETISKTPQTELVAVVDLDEEKARKASEKWKVPYFTNSRTLFEKMMPDIICCAAGAQANASTIYEASVRGAKGVYCEKPLVLSLKEADELATLESKTKTKFQVNYLRNYDTCHNSVIEYIRSGGIGNLQAVRTTYNGGVMSVFPHTTALLGKLFDKPVSVSAVLSPIANISTRADPNVDGTIRYHFGPYNRDVSVQLLATGRGKAENNTYIYELEFTGSKARISIKENGWRVEYEEMLPSRIFTGFETHPYRVDRIPLELNAEAPREFMLNGLQQLISAIENDTPTNCNLACARDAEEIAHALAISACRNGQSVALPLEDRTHAFENARAGVALLMEQAGIAPK